MFGQKSKKDFLVLFGAAVLPAFNVFFRRDLSQVESQGYNLHFIVGDIRSLG